MKNHPQRWSRLPACSTIVLAILFLPGLVGAEFAQKEWTRWREILLPDNAAPAAHVLVDLDGKVFAASQMDLQDLRVADDQGAEVPSKLITQSLEARDESFRVEILDRVSESDGSLRLTLDLGEKPPRHNHLELQTDSHNFSRQVRIEASDDNRRWSLVREDGYIFDFSREAEARYLEITYPRSSKRYLRVTVLKGSEKYFSISGAAIKSSSVGEGKRIEHSQTVVSNAIDPKLRARVVVLDLAYAKLPTSRIEFETPAANFHRHVEIEGSNQPLDALDSARQFWTPIGTGEIFSIALDRANRRKMEIDYSESRFRFLRIKVFHYDDAPIDIARINASGRPYSLLFQRSPGKTYRLYYGNSAAAAARYDLEQLFPYLDLAKLNHVQLGPEQQQQAPAKPAPRLEARPIWLWAILALAAILIAGLIYRLARMTGS